MATSASDKKHFLTGVTLLIGVGAPKGDLHYTVIHLLVVDVGCVLFWTQSVCIVPHQNTRNIYHKQMNNGVIDLVSRKMLFKHQTGKRAIFGL